MSIAQNSSTISKRCSAGESSWAEDFIDLTEFCQPFTKPMKIGRSVDERVNLPTSSARNHGRENSLRINEMEQAMDDNLWSIPSPMAIQDELCDRISDWLSEAKGANHDVNSMLADNLPFRDEISYNIDDVLSKSHLTPLVPSIMQHQQKKPTLNFNFSAMPAQQPPASICSFSHSDNISSNRRRNSKPFLPENLVQSNAEKLLQHHDHHHHHHHHLNNVNLIYADKAQETCCQHSRHDQFLEAAGSTMAHVPVLSSPVHQFTQNGISSSTNTSQLEKLNVQHCGKAITSSSKNSDFDLVSFVFEENKSTLDGSNLQKYAQSVVAIKTEADDGSLDNPRISAVEKMYGKHELEEDIQFRAKRSRRCSTCSSEDHTQFESEKYRELRNKNNEASRRSRANRKTREVEMKEYANKLETENRRLTTKFKEMENLLKRLRSCLMQIVLQNKR